MKRYSYVIEITNEGDTPAFSASDVYDLIVEGLTETYSEDFLESTSVSVRQHCDPKDIS